MHLPMIEKQYSYLKGFGEELKCFDKKFTDY